jgi:hypothetical protein
MAERIDVLTEVAILNRGPEETRIAYIHGLAFRSDEIL